MGTLSCNKGLSDCTKNGEDNKIKKEHFSPYFLVVYASVFDELLFFISFFKNMLIKI